MITDNSLVSILIPAFKSENWIAETLRSAVNQTWPHKEIIVVDDGSSDKTLEIAKQFESQLVLVVTQPNRGAPSARNHAFSLCRGDYIQWLDADDVLAPDKIERQMNVAIKNRDPRILYSGEWGHFLKRTSKADFCPTLLWHDLSPLEFFQRKMEHNLHMQPDCWLVSRELTEKAGPWDESLRRDNDGEYFGRLMLNASKIEFVAGAKSYYRRTGTSSISYVGKSEIKIESLFRSINLHVSYIRSLDDGVKTRRACLSYLNTWLHYFFPQRMDLVAQLRELASELGGDLPDPQLRWKYRLVKVLFGWKAAKAAQRVLPTLKEAIQRKLESLFS